MAMSRKERRAARAAAQTPAPEDVFTPSAPAAPAPGAEELRVLRERLESLEKVQAGPEAGWNPWRAHRAEMDAWIAQRTRETGAPCSACGAAGGPLRKVECSAFPWSLGWVCDLCAQAVEPGWGTAHRILPGKADALSRLACLAAGLDEPVPGFLALAQRYGLTFRLAHDSDGKAEGAWSHLDLPAWRDVAAKAVRRRAAGFGTFPAATPPHQVQPAGLRVGHIADWSAPAGSRPGFVAVEQPEPTAEEAAAVLRAEEAAIEAVLTQREQERARAAKEEAARRAEEERRREILAHYKEHRDRLEAHIENVRAQLRGDLERALREPAEWCA